MQPQRIKNDEVSSLSPGVVGARGANAAQRAARAFELGLLSEANNDDSKPEKIGQTSADLPTARQPDTRVNDNSTAAKPAATRSLRKRMLIGIAAALMLAAGGWYGDHCLTVGRFIVSTGD